MCLMGMEQQRMSCLKIIKRLRLTIRDEVNWHDGNPVTGEDLEFAYLTIGHPEYKGARYDSSISND